MIIDPAINNANNYKPYQDGVGQDVFIKVCEASQFLINFVTSRFVYVTKIMTLDRGEGSK